MKVVKGILKLLLILLLVAVLLAALYVGYVLFKYNRIADYTPLELENPREGQLLAGQQYTALTYNIGFGAYDQEFSFFMDEGAMNDGTQTRGESSRAESALAVEANVRGATEAMRQYDPDFLLLQEVDLDSDRSYHTDQMAFFTAAFPEHSYVYASNFHTPYLFWPPTKPIGEIESGLVSLSRYEVTNSVRRSYPVDDSLPDKLFDLDRCFTAQWIPVEDTGAELVLINTHMSAYDEGGVIRAAQMQLLADMIASEYDKGNYVIVGGDFNHILGIAADTFASGQPVPDWVVELDLSELPEGFSLVSAQNATEVATCRGADIPYTPGVNYTTVIDGFLVSDNVSASAWNIDLQFMYSDHNPVQLTFSLLPTEDGGEANEETGAEEEAFDQPEDATEPEEAEEIPMG